MSSLVSGANEVESKTVAVSVVILTHGKQSAFFDRTNNLYQTSWFNSTVTEQLAPLF